MQKVVKKIILLGYMGSGKTKTGKALSQLLNYKFVDLDRYITKKTHRTISEIFNQKGEAYFRKKEKKYLKKILNKDKNMVIALGGGTPEVKGIMELINAKGLSIYLKADKKILAERLKPERVERPLLSNLPDDFLESYIEDHLASRQENYEKAKLSIDVSQLDTTEIVQKILTEINRIESE